MHQRKVLILRIFFDPSFYLYSTSLASQIYSCYSTIFKYNLHFIFLLFLLFFFSSLTLELRNLTSTYRMNVKIDTKEKFTVITPEEMKLSANMTAELRDLLLGYLQKDIPHIVLNMKNVRSVDGSAEEKLAQVQQQFYENNCSFVICNLQPEIVEICWMKKNLELMNVTPTESEAWDILQMEEIERELLGGEE